MMESDPDQLLKSLDAAMAMSRAKHARTGANRNAFRIASIAILLIGTLAALVLLQYMVSQLPVPPHPEKAAPAQKRGF
jgi:hypothetical protein